MIGAILGDIIGSVYEFNNIKTKKFPLFSKRSIFTDDTVMTLALADALLAWRSGDPERLRSIFVEKMVTFGKRYPDAGYGARFSTWLYQAEHTPYCSYGNGSAMRVSPVAYWAKSFAEALLLAEASADVTHNHPEGIKGAVVTAGATYLALHGADKTELRCFIEQYYDIGFTLDDIRPTYTFNETCQETVPQAMVAFLESESFEDAIRLAVSIGGDSDTLAAITGSVAEGFYGVPGKLYSAAISYLDDCLSDVVCRFAAAIV